MNIAEIKFDQYMNKRILDNGYIVTRYEYIDEKISRGFYPEIQQVPKVNFNRRKYNRMDCQREQDEYEKKCEELKDAYYLITPDHKRRIKINKNMYKYAIKQITTK